MFKFLRNMFKRDRKIVSKINNNNMVFIDLGASSVKACDNKGNCINFRSSIRVIASDEEVTIQDGVIQVNGTWYSVGESGVSPSMEILKHKKQYFEVLIMYALFKLGIKDKESVSVNLLLPFTQLCYKSEFKKVLEGVNWSVKSKKIALNYNTKITGCYSEGEMSVYHINNIFNIKGKNKVIINIGYSTIDVLVLNRNNTREKILSVALGIRDLLEYHASSLSIGTGAMLNAFVADGYTYKYNKDILQANREYITEVMTSIYITCLKRVNPQNTQCFICGGGCMVIGDELKAWIKKEELIKDFNVKVLEGDNALYTDLLGMFNYVNSESIINEETEITPIKESVKDRDIIEVTPVEDVEKEITPNNIDNEVLENKQITLLGEITPVKKNNTRLDYKVLIPEVLETYNTKPTLTELQNKFSISKQQARTLASKCF